MNKTRHWLRTTGKPTIESRIPIFGSVVSVRTAAPELVMTFDDGPDPLGTPAVLEALAQFGATATFFVLGTRIRRYPGLLADILAQGHEVGLHGADHRRLTGSNYRNVRRRLAEARTELEQVTGSAVQWFRPPYGAQSPITWAAARRANLVPVLWSATTWDWKSIPQSERVAKALIGARPGCIVLAHDAFAGPEDRAFDQVAPEIDRADLVHHVLEGYATVGLRARTLSEVAAGGSLQRAARFTR